MILKQVVMFGHADQCKQVFNKDCLETFHCTVC